MSALKKIIEQKQIAVTKVAKIKKIPKKKNSSLLDQYKHNDYNIDKL